MVPLAIQVELSKIVEPELPMRETMTDDGLEELASSIRQLGVLAPILVQPKGDGLFEIVAGHRRVLAARLAGLVTVPAMIHEDAETAVAARVHENLVREDVLPAEEAVYYAQLYDQLGEDVDRVAATVRRSRDYVEKRLLLLRGYPDVLEALRAGRVNLGQAEELNRFQLEADARYYLEYSERAGASIRQLREWRAQANARAELKKPEPGPAGEGKASPDPSAASPAPAGPLYASLAKPWEFSSSTELRDCLFCGERREEWKLYRKFVCQPCADRHLVPLETGRGQDGR